MGYTELLKALEDEVARQARGVEEEAEREASRLIEEARRDLAAAREAATLAEGRRLDVEAARALARARLDAEREALVQKRRILDDLRREADAALERPEDPELLARLADEVIAECLECGEGAVEFRVASGDAGPLRAHLAARHPSLLARATVTGTPEVRGGVEVRVGGLVLDNTLAGRLAKAWPLLEGAVAARLFGEGRGGH